MAPAHSAVRFAALAWPVVGWQQGHESHIADRIADYWSGEPEPTCTSEACSKPDKKYERIMNTQPGYQWNDADGYCGSWSVQRAAMAKGAWISQQQVRDHTVHGAGVDHEIDELNIDLALKNLKLKVAKFDYETLPAPQLDSGRKFMKQQLAAGHVLVQMIMLPGGRYPIDPGLPYGDYTHIEPIVGIMSDKPLSDEDFYDDDYIVHYNDASTRTLYRSMKSLPGTYYYYAECPLASGGSEMCLHPKYVFSWAVQGFLDEKEGLPLSLTVDPWEYEPDIRSGESPTALTGTVTIDDLQVGDKYALYRWDSVESAFDYSNPASTHRFTASSTTEVYTDTKTFSSGGTTYYRCIADDSAPVEV